ncbi:hypothetical protein Cni_G14103 [Canna indica]|uniref:DUF4408 domain-containing protein n=1 Tax=Canna indica TaxID=4628 RepID=A0AAQ3KDF5_9LILI|nr:hypothetical protein Cni_G14103 [Canna indica]
MANQKWNSRTSGFQTAIWVAKIAFWFFGIVSCGAVARAAVPAAAEALASALPGSWASLRSWIAPPYLFVAVHFIVVVIWKLSNPKHHHHEEWAAEERIVELGNPVKFKAFEPPPAAGFLQKPSPKIWRNEVSKSTTTGAVPTAVDLRESSPNEPRLTTDSVEGSTALPAPAVRESVEPESKSGIAVTKEAEDEASAPPPPPPPPLEETESAPMDATWKGFIKKSSPLQAPPPPPPPPAETAPRSTSHDDELNRRFEEFIKRNHEQIRHPEASWGYVTPDLLGLKKLRGLRFSESCGRSCSARGLLVVCEATTAVKGYFRRFTSFLRSICVFWWYCSFPFPLLLSGFFLYVVSILVKLPRRLGFWGFLLADHMGKPSSKDGFPPLHRVGKGKLLASSSDCEDLVNTVGVLSGSKVPPHSAMVEIAPVMASVGHLGSKSDSNKVVLITLNPTGNNLPPSNRVTSSAAPFITKSYVTTSLNDASRPTSLANLFKPTVSGYNVFSSFEMLSKVKNLVADFIEFDEVEHNKIHKLLFASLISRFLHKPPAHFHLHNRAFSLWSSFNLANVIDLENDFFLFRFDFENNTVKVLSEGLVGMCGD